MSYNTRALARSGLPFMFVIIMPVRYAMHPCPLTFTPARLTHPELLRSRRDGPSRADCHITQAPRATRLRILIPGALKANRLCLSADRDALVLPAHGTD